MRLYDVRNKDMRRGSFEVFRSGQSRIQAMQWMTTLRTAPVVTKTVFASCSAPRFFDGAHYNKIYCSRIKTLVCSQPVSPTSAVNAPIGMTKLDIKLSNGTPVPALGFGAGTAWYNTAGNDPTKPLNQELISSMKSAIDVGYHHLDLAEVSRI